MKPVLFCSILFCSLLLPAPLLSAEKPCLACHEKLTKGAVVHAALPMGCETCHSAIDARTVPHKKKTGVTKGLSAEQPALCYGCHDQAQFTKKTVHAALGMGCTACHNPHSSNNAKLLLGTVPDLCFTCHDKASFTRKNVHAPVAGGMCLACHAPHSSEHMALLLKKPYELCLDCHGDVIKKPHAVSGFSSGRHPLGEPRLTKTGEEKARKDPARPGKPFYCGSCHDPHSSDSPTLFRFNAKSSMGLCVNCHKM
jgi:predicted CXXCH cytochrome family protein